METTEPCRFGIPSHASIDNDAGCPQWKCYQALWERIDPSRAALSPVKGQEPSCDAVGVGGGGGGHMLQRKDVDMSLTILCPSPSANPPLPISTYVLNQRAIWPSDRATLAGSQA